MRRCSRGGYPPRHKTTAPAGSAGCFERECSCFAPVCGLGCGGTLKNNDIAIPPAALPILRRLDFAPRPTQDIMKGRVAHEAAWCRLNPHVVTPVVVRVGHRSLVKALQWVEPAIASQGQRLRKIPARNRSAPRPDDLCFARSPLSECPQRRCAEAGKSG